MTKRQTNWARLGPCRECGAETGQPCRNLHPGYRTGGGSEPLRFPGGARSIRYPHVDANGKRSRRPIDESKRAPA